MTLPHICFIAVHIYPVLVQGTGLGFVGGAEVQQAVQMRALRRAGYRISVLAKDDGQPDVVEVDGITIHKIPSDAGRGLRGTRFLYPRLTDVVGLLRRVAPDVVFVQAAGEQLAAAALYARTAGKRLVFAGASDPDFARGVLPGMSRWHSTLYRLGLRGAHEILVQNQAQRDALARNFGRRGRLVQNGYDERGTQPASFEGHVLWVATIKPLKRPDLFIELARRLPGRRCVMVGGAGLAPDAQRFLESVQHSAAGVANLELTGHVPFDQVGRWFDGAALVINTSDYEGLPNTFMQAWIRGTPTLSFVRPESSPGVSGTIACDDIEDMAAKARVLTTDRGAWARASAACRRHFEAHHTLERAVAHYAEAFAAAVPA
ncbi:MAG TPA: glycosyltransferase family 4 protein [Burkholderiaceae bacterium]